MNFNDLLRNREVMQPKFINFVEDYLNADIIFYGFIGLIQAVMKFSQQLLE
jgi:hypothetical protein